MEKEYINKEELAEIKERTLIIDVRDKLEYQTLKTFPNSINIPYNELVAEPEKYISDKNKLVITYCNYGNRSSKAANFLRKKGYSRTLSKRGNIWHQPVKKINKNLKYKINNLMKIDANAKKNNNFN